MSIRNWIEQRTGIAEAWRRRCDRTSDSSCCCLDVWPGLILFTFLVQAITGLALWMYYSPGSQSAWESVHYIQYDVWGGWLVRGIHYYAAQALLVVCMLYVLHTILTAAYRAPRELVYWLALGLAMLTIALLLTGELLAWTQSAYWSTFVRTNFLFLLPGVGTYLHKLAVGGPTMGNLTATRFLALHAGLLPVLFGLAWCLLRYASRRAAAVVAAQADNAVAASGEGRAAGAARVARGGWWPRRAAGGGMAWLALMLVVVLLCCQGLWSPHAADAEFGDYLGVELGGPRDPGEQYAAARPDWYFVGLFQFAHLFPGEYKIVPIFVIPGLLVALFVLMPFIARNVAGQLFNVVVTLGLLIGMVYLSIESKQADAGNASHQASLADAATEADRVKELIRQQGIPPTGALSLLLDDPVVQGPKLFKQHCVSCHDLSDAEGNGMLADKPTAPNLHGFAGKPWLQGLLDPKQIAYNPKPEELSPTNRPRYFGSTKFVNGDMAKYVKQELPELRKEKEDEANIQALIAVLAAEGRRPASGKATKAEIEAVELGGCLGCHKYYGKGAASAPELTGYASKEWLAGIIKDPSHKLYYGKKNDRMPAYHASPDKPSDNLLTARQVEMLAEWLRTQNP